jgi:hypothetical protein
MRMPELAFRLACAYGLAGTARRGEAARVPLYDEEEHGAPSGRGTWVWYEALSRWDGKERRGHGD